MRKIYAIGFKNWVELRSYENPPIPETSEFKKIIKEKITGYDWTKDPPKMITKEIEVPWHIKTTIYSGGKVIYTLKSGKLKYLGAYVGDGGCKEIDKETLKVLVSKGFEKLKKYI